MLRIRGINGPSHCEFYYLCEGTLSPHKQPDAKLSYKSTIRGVEIHHLKVEKDSSKEFKRVESECEIVELDSESL